MHPDPARRRPERAIEAARRNLELEPSDNAWNTLGIALYRGGEYKESVEALTESMRLAGGGQSIDWLVVAMSLEKLGLHDQALEWFRRGERSYTPLGGRVSKDDWNPFVEGEVELSDEGQMFLEEARQVLRVDAARP